MFLQILQTRTAPENSSQCALCCSFWGLILKEPEDQEQSLCCLLVHGCSSQPIPTDRICSLYRAGGEDGDRCLQFVFMPNLCNEARTGSSCALQFTSFTDKIIFKHCLLLNRSTKEFVFFSFGKQGRICVFLINHPLPNSHLLTLYC